MISILFLRIKYEPSTVPSIFTNTNPHHLPFRNIIIFSEHTENLVYKQVTKLPKDTLPPSSEAGA